MFRILTEEENLAKETGEGGDRKMGKKAEKGKPTQQSFFQLGETIFSTLLACWEMQSLSVDAENCSSLPGCCLCSLGLC